MLEISVTEEFERRYVRLPSAIRKKLQKQERLFRSNPFHPSLHVEKLQPTRKEVWSFRVDRSYRVLFRFTESEEVLFLTVGSHAWIYRFPF